MKLRLFMDCDYDCYAGVEAQSPRISSGEVLVNTNSQLENENFEGDAVLDGKRVDFYMVGDGTPTKINKMEDDTEDEIIFTKEFKDEFIAHLFLESCPNKLKAHELIGWGFSVTVNGF